MTAQGNPKNLSAYNGSGTESAPSPLTGLVTLTATDDFYFPVPSEVGDPVSIHILTDANLVGTFTVETCNFPRRIGDTAQLDVADYNETVGNWVKEDPSTAYVASVGTGWTVTNLTLAKTAGAGGAMIHLGNLGSRRLRIKAAITTTGACRVVSWGKD